MAPTMLAWTHTKRGPPSDILSLRTVSKPDSIPKNHVLVKVTHAALSPSSSLLIKAIPNPWGTTKIACEMDFGGIIEAMGPGVRPELQHTGTEVFGILYPESHVGVATFKGGTLAEYVLARQDLVAVKPANVSAEAAAGLAGVGATAVRFLDYAKLSPSQSVLINGGSGGLGTMLVQIAKHIVGPEGKVVAICSGRNAEMVKILGADEVVDYTAPVHQPLGPYLATTYADRKFDAIIDTIGTQPLYTHSPGYLKEAGQYLQSGAMPLQGDFTISNIAILAWTQLCNALWPVYLGGTKRTFKLLTTTPDAYLIDKVRGYVEEGVVKGVVDSVWSFEDALKAYERMDSQRARGKIIIEVAKLSRAMGEESQTRK